MLTTTIIINHYALRYNLQRLRKLAPTSKFIAIIKANAYGHGLLETAKILHDADAFGVARLEEALRLRNNGITQPILLLGGFFDPADLSIIAEYDLDITIHNEEQLYALETQLLGKPVTIWMKIDTGMHRLGIRPESADAFYQRLSQCINVRQPVNIISHFACANKTNCSVTKQQQYIFETFCKNKAGMRSIASSKAILLWSQSHFDWVRPGIILYGISPLENGSLGKDFNLKPVMSLVSYLIAVRKHKVGESVGYGGTWISKRDTYIGVVAIGYGDGYPCVPSGTPVLINNREVPIVGSVTMDMMCVDLGPYASDKVGDLVILWGENLPVERIAQITKISVYTLITQLTSRVAINFIN